MNNVNEDCDISLTKVFFFVFVNKIITSSERPVLAELCLKQNQCAELSTVSRV